jgi:hypothetical protein
MPTINKEKSMSSTSVSQQATSGTAALVAAAASLAQHHITRNGTTRRPGETGERYLPLATLDVLIAVDEGGVWTVTVYAPRSNGNGITEVAVVTGAYIDGRILGAHLDALGDPSRHAQAAGEIRAFVATLPAVAQAAESEAA